MTPGLGRSNVPGCNKPVVSRHVVGVEDKNVSSGAQARFDALYRETSGPLLSYLHVSPGVQTMAETILYKQINAVP